MNYLLPLVSGKLPLGLAGKLILLAAFIVSLVWTGLQTVHFVSLFELIPAAAPDLPTSLPTELLP